MRARAVLLTIGVAALCAGVWCAEKHGVDENVKLPAARTKGQMSIEEAIARRRSVRSFTERALTLEQLSQLLWCAQGITDERGARRASPSAGATYPMEIFVAAGSDAVAGLAPGVYRYIPKEHALACTKEEDIRRQVAAAALNQGFLAEAPVVILIAAEPERTTKRYGRRGTRYVHMEVGHIGQNLYLQAESLGLATVAVGAFEDEKVAKAFSLPAELEPLYLMPIGHPR